MVSKENLALNNALLKISYLPIQLHVPSNVAFVKNIAVLFRLEGKNWMKIPRDFFYRVLEGKKIILLPLQGILIQVGIKLLNSQYFWKWTHANPMKFFRQAATVSKL